MAGVLHGIRALPFVGTRNKETGIQLKNDKISEPKGITDTNILSHFDDFILTDEEILTRNMLFVNKSEEASTDPAIIFETRKCLTVNFGEVFASHAAIISSNSFLCDSGASHHIVHDRRMFTKFEPFTRKFKILQVSGELEVTHFGTVLLEVDGTNGKEHMSIGNVLLLECLPFNIFSLQKARQNDFYYEFKQVPGKITLLKDTHNGKVHRHALITESRGRWTLDARIIPPPLPLEIPEVRVCSLSIDLLHRRMAHTSEKVMKRMVKDDMADGIGTLSGQVSPCDACQLGKLTRPSHPPVPFDHGTTRPLQLVVMYYGANANEVP